MLFTKCVFCGAVCFFLGKFIRNAKWYTHNITGRERRVDTAARQPFRMPASGQHSQQVMQYVWHKGTTYGPSTRPLVIPLGSLWLPRSSIYDGCLYIFSIASVVTWCWITANDQQLKEKLCLPKKIQQQQKKGIHLWCYRKLKIYKPIFELNRTTLAFFFQNIQKQQ